MNELVQILKNTRQHLMTGVSHMIPFVVSGGILLAVSVMLYGKGAVPDAVADPNLKKLFDIGVAGLTLMVPFLAAYIGYSIAERSALAPCAIGAWVGNSFGAGFFGALIAGIIGGIVVHYLKKIPVHKVLRSVMPIFIIPIVGTLITAGVMMWGLGEPVGALTSSLTQWLQGMQQGSVVMLAVIMGLMLAFDMGGPVNKVAYAFMLICVAQGVYTVVAIAAVGICVPPLGMGLATLCDEVLFDLKIMDPNQARQVVKMNLPRVLENLRLLVSEGVNVIPRLPLIPGYTLTKENMQQALDVLIPLNIRQIHLLPFHQYGEPKYRLLGKTWSMTDVSAPSLTDVALMRGMAERAGFQVTVGG